MTKIKDIDDVFTLFKEYGLTQFSYKDEDIKIELKKEIQQPVMVQAEPLQNMAPVTMPQPQEMPASAAKPEEKPATVSGNEIKSPIHGNFYRASSPDAKPFIEVGQTISEGQVVCIIESMKLMNEIKSPFSGKVVDILIENGKPVGKGESIIIIE